MDGFVSRFLPDGSAVDFSTYLGGDGNDVFHTLTLDNADNIHFIGWSSSTDFPLIQPLQAMPGGGNDLIVGTIVADLTALGFSTYLGGGLSDHGRAIAVDSRGRAHVAGDTMSADFPVLDPLQPGIGGATDSFITTIELGLPIFMDGFESGNTSAWSNTAPEPMR
jgi:hypothetical protein